jgi:AI-2E family transporter
MNHLISAEKPVEGRKLIELAYLVVILVAFAWAKEFLLPLILAILISFLLAPAVSRLERWRFPGVIAILSVVGIAFALIAGLCSTLSIQGLDLVNSLPKYRENIHARWAALQHGPPGPLNLAFSNVDAVIADLGKVSESAGVTEKQEPTKVQIVSGTDSILAIVKNSLAPVIGPIGEFAVVVVLVVFMLLERKQIRVRFLRLIGHSRVVTTTLAIEELILPALRAIENDLYPGAASPTKSRIYAQLRELIEEMNVEIPTESERSPEQSTSSQPVMAIVPFMGESDEIVGSVIGRLLAAEGIGTVLLSWKTLRAEKVERLKERKAHWILLSAIESRSVSTMGKMAYSKMPGSLFLGLLS